MIQPEFSLLDGLFFTTWLLIITVIIITIKVKNRENPDYWIFGRFMIYKLFFGVLFSVVYTYVYKGGDTTAYWYGGKVLNNLFFSNPTAYLNEIWNYNPKNLIQNYDIQSGYPPSWIYVEYSSWFVSKISSFFSFLTFGSYYATNLIVSFCSGLICYRFYVFMNSKLSINKTYLAIALLFVPSVAFWCTGVAKDTITFSCILLVITSVWSLLYSKFKWKYLILLFICSYLILQIRPVYMMAIIVPFAIVYIFKISREKVFLVKLLIRTIGIATAIILVTFLSFDSLIKTAEITYNDFQNNSLYQGKRYDLGLTEFTPSSMLTVFPLAVITTLFRPFLWESESILMILNGLESLATLLLTTQIFRKKNRHKSNSTKNSEQRDLIIFSIGFVIILAFIVGLTSGLFGVLSRLKSPIIPFFLIIIFSRIQKQETSEKKEEY